MLEVFLFCGFFTCISVINSIVSERQLYLNLGVDVSAFITDLIPKSMFQNMLNMICLLVRELYLRITAKPLQFRI